MPTAVLNPTAPTAELTRADRCDACGAQAFVAATSPASLPLLFCGHHGRANIAGLKAAGFTVVDQTHRINAAPSASSA